MRRVPIVQGEFRVFGQPNVMITTLLGSCIAVCLFDPVARIGGMNHFLLGEPRPNSPVRAGEANSYGIHAMELLINELMKGGAARSRLTAHLYGGANIIRRLNGIGESNAVFARRFLDTEGIPIRFADLGGERARKVEFLPHAGKSRCTAVADPLPPVSAADVRAVRAAQQRSARVPPTSDALAFGELEMF